MTETVYPACPIKRKRRTRAEMEALREGLLAILQDENPSTARHVFYRAVAAGLVEKTEQGYDNGVVRNLTILRKQKRLPYHWLSDSTRWTRRVTTYRSRAEAVRDVAESYRRNLWDGKDVRVEIWSEKDAIASLLFDAADEFCVPVMVFRGYSSQSYLYELAETILEDGRPTYIYYFGDRDPSGLDIERFVTDTVRELAPGAEIRVQRLAVTEDQIRQFNLPTRPTKKSDSRAKNFHGESVEVDAISGELLKDICRAAILSHLDTREVEQLRIVEEGERDWLLDLAQQIAEATA